MRLIVCIVVMIHQCYSDEQKWSFYVLNFTISIFIQLEKFKSSSRLCECEAAQQITFRLFTHHRTHIVPGVVDRHSHRVLKEVEVGVGIDETGHQIDILIYSERKYELN